ncbi:MAG: hypothetical protein IKU60_04825 [Clostridia bacterium]|nr:hypothetical protein [Clostridia bacterium]
MKKIFGLMIITGMFLAMTTAGGVDSGIISSGRIVVQSLISAILMLTGGVLSGRSAQV